MNNVGKDTCRIPAFHANSIERNERLNVGHELKHIGPIEKHDVYEKAVLVELIGLMGDFLVFSYHVLASLAQQELIE